MRIIQTPAMGLVLCTLTTVVLAQQTPPIPPRVQETPIPPPVTLPAIAPPEDVPNRPLSAEEAARIALRHQYNVTVARANISAAQGRTQQTRSGLMPTVGVSGGYTNLQTLTSENRGGGGSSSTGSSSSATTGSASSGFVGAVNLRQLLFDFNHTRDLVRQSEALERAATQNLSRVQSDLVFQVKQAYYQYTQSTELVTISEENLRNRQAQRDLARARLNSGLGLPSDVVTAETAVDAAISSLSQARANEVLARVNLALLMGIDPRTPLIARENVEPPLTTDDVNALVSTGLSRRPELLQAQENLRSAQFGVSAARTTNAPSLAANLGLGTRGENFPPGTDTLSIGLSVQWNPFDGGLTAGRVREARANVDIAQAQLTGTQQTVVSDVSQAYVNLRSAEQRVVSTQAEVANAMEGLRIAEGRFRSGLGLFLDILTAQTALVSARTDQANAVSVRQQARAALSRAIGAPLPR